MKSRCFSWTSILLMAVLVFSVVSCSSECAPPTPPPPEPTGASATTAPDKDAPITEGDLSTVYAPRGQIDNLDPSRLPSVNDVDMQRKIFESLVDYMDDGTELLLGAEKYEANETGDVYTFYLRKDAKWSDGQPVTAHDYVFGWRRLFDPVMANTNASTVYIIKNGAPINNGEIDDLTQLGVKAVDDYTLEVTLEQPAGYFPTLVNALYPIREDIVKEFGDKWVDPENIVCNGPYVLQVWEKDVQLVFERNPQYWGEPAKIAKIVYKLMEDPYSTAPSMYEAGELDIAPFPPEEYARIKADPELAEQVVLQPQATVYWVVFDTGKPPFDDVRVRQAFNLAVDREGYVNGVLQGLGLPAYIIPSPDVAGRNEDAFVGTRDYAQDVEKARALMAEAGYPNGQGFPEVELKYRTRFLEQKMGEALPAMWEKALGVKINPEPTEAQAYRAWFQSRAEQPYDMMVYGWVADNEPVNWFNAIFVSSADLYHSRWANKEFDDLVAKAAAETDPETRIKMYKQADEILERETPYLPVLHVVEPYLIKPWLKGPVSSTSGYYNLQWGWIVTH
jgi:oligopeptide transport system substrate-binding protein